MKIIFIYIHSASFYNRWIEFKLGNHNNIHPSCSCATDTHRLMFTRRELFLMAREDSLNHLPLPVFYCDICGEPVGSNIVWGKLQLCELCWKSTLDNDGDERKEETP